MRLRFLGRFRRPTIVLDVLFALVVFYILSPQTSSAAQVDDRQALEQDHGLTIRCSADAQEVNLGQSVTIKCGANGRGLIYSFGASAGAVSVSENSAMLSTAAVPKTVKSITVLCSAVSSSGQSGQTTVVVNIVTPPPSQQAGEKLNLFGIVAPNMSWTTGTQTQTLLGGSTILSGVRSTSYCDSTLHQFGIAANASDTATKKSSASTVNLDNNEVKVDATTGIFGHPDSKDKTIAIGNSYLGIDADFFGNNSLGIGLQQTYAAEYQYYLRKCTDSHDVGDHRLFASVGIGAGFMNQRLYVTADKLNAAVLPLSAQVSYLLGESPGKPPRLIVYGLLGYLPVLTDMHAYQASAIVGVQIPTRFPWLTVALTDSDLYMNNAPTGFKRNYQNGSISLAFTFPPNPAKVPNPAIPDSDKGACYGGDKLARLYCFDEVTIDSCVAPNMFRRSQHCSSSGVTPAFKTQ
jgi:hypothetical protein